MLDRGLETRKLAKVFVTEASSQHEFLVIGVSPCSALDGGWKVSGSVLGWKASGSALGAGVGRELAKFGLIFWQEGAFVHDSRAG